MGREMYDHITDSVENRNCVDGERYEDVLMELSDMLQAGWRRARPDS